MGRVGFRGRKHILFHHFQKHSLMKKKIPCVMLIDDDDDDNFFHQMVLKEVDVANRIEVAESGLEALDYLKNGREIPELIFLDINMPKMNGWEFLYEYKKLDIHHKAKVVIIMLTTSLNPADEEKANTIPEISGFRNKPLDNKMLKEIVHEFFRENE